MKKSNLITEFSNQSENKRDPSEKAASEHHSSQDLSVFQNVIMNPESASPADILRMQSLAGNSATNDWLKNQNPHEDSGGNGSGKLDSSISREINAERGKGKSLDPNTSKSLGKDFRYNFKDVRLHTGPRSETLTQRLHARAFTSGSDIFFNENSGPQDKTTLRHELTHVVQQGGKATSGDLYLGKPDTTEEHQAESVSKSSSSKLSDLTVSGMERPVYSAQIQRLMSLKTFKSRSNERFASRSKSTITQIDSALEKIPPGDDIYANRAQYLELYKLCNTFLVNSDEKSDKRREGVTLLKNEIEEEVGQRIIKFKEDIQAMVTSDANSFSKKGVELGKLGIFIDFFKASINLGASETTKTDIMSGMTVSINKTIDDQLDELEALDFDTTDFSLIQGKLKTTALWIETKKNVLNLDVTADESRVKLLKQKLIQKDLDELETLKNDPDTPDETRAFLGEILANKGKIYFEGGASGAKKKDIDGKQYLLKHNISDTSMDKGERLGSLAHELTHVSVGEKFDNSALLFSYAKTADPAAVKDLIKTRKENVIQAVSLAVNCPELKAGDGSKLKIVKGKLDYAAGDKVGLYINRFVESKEISKVEADELRDKLSTLGLNNVVVEYDSVVNQILTYLAVWGVPKTDPFYQFMLRIGKEANLYRTT